MGQVDGCERGESNPEPGVPDPPVDGEPGEGHLEQKAHREKESAPDRRQLQGEKAAHQRQGPGEGQDRPQHAEGGAHGGRCVRVDVREQTPCDPEGEERQGLPWRHQAEPVQPDRGGAAHQDASVQMGLEIGHGVSSGRARTKGGAAGMG